VAQHLSCAHARRKGECSRGNRHPRHPRHPTDTPPGEMAMSRMAPPPTSLTANPPRTAKQSNALLLSDEQLEALADLLAPRLAAHLRAPATDARPLVDANTLAAELGMSREWVYEHAHELGERVSGDGPRARKRFDVEQAREAMRRLANKRSHAAEPNGGGGSRPSSRRGGRRSPNGAPKPGSILAVRGKA
jgi:hypothetical protein